MRQSHFFSLDYVKEILEVLFSSSVEVLTETSIWYKERVPDPLNCQFPQRLDKEAAIQWYHERHETTTLPVPNGKKYIIY